MRFEKHTDVKTQIFLEVENTPVCKTNRTFDQKNTITVIVFQKLLCFQKNTTWVLITFYFGV